MDTVKETRQRSCEPVRRITKQLRPCQRLMPTLNPDRVPRLVLGSVVIALGGDESDDRGTSTKPTAQSAMGEGW